MRRLAKGNDASVILKLIKIMLTTQEADFDAVTKSDTTAIGDIAGELTVDKPLFNAE